MRLFDSVIQERNAAYADAGISNPIPRPRNASLMNFRYHSHVTCFDPFQSAKDFQGDLQAIFIKPMTCYLLSWYHAGRSLYELGLTVVHLLTFSADTGRHAEKMFDSFIKSYVYDLLFYIELYTQALSFAMRCFISLGTGAYKVSEGIVNIFNQATLPAAENPSNATAFAR